MRANRWPAWAVCVLLVVLGSVLGSATPASAHAELVGTDPAQGAVLDRMPDLRFLFLTGYADSAAIDEAVNGRARILKKPVSAAALATAIEELLA